MNDSNKKKEIIQIGKLKRKKLMIEIGNKEKGRNGKELQKELNRKEKVKMGEK